MFNVVEIWMNKDFQRYCFRIYKNLLKNKLEYKEYIPVNSDIILPVQDSGRVPDSFLSFKNYFNFWN